MGKDKLRNLSKLYIRNGGYRVYFNGKNLRVVSSPHPFPLLQGLNLSCPFPSKTLHHGLSRDRFSDMETHFDVDFSKACSNVLVNRNKMWSKQGVSWKALLGRGRERGGVTLQEMCFLFSWSHTYQDYNFWRKFNYIYSLCVPKQNIFSSLFGDQLKK